MSKPESRFAKVVGENLSPFGVVHRIENAIDLGTADVAYVLTRIKAGSAAASGWIELKVLDDYPARPSTAIRIAHFEKEQLLFLEAWVAAGGRAWLLLRAPPWTLLFDAAGARAVYERRVAAADGPAIARAAGFGVKFPTGPVLRALTG